LGVTAGLPRNKMKSFLRIFELTKDEQRVVLIVMLILITIAFVAYERCVHHSAVGSALATQPTASPTPVETEDQH
jgi:hypothetical protein